MSSYIYDKPSLCVDLTAYETPKEKIRLRRRKEDFMSFAAWCKKNDIEKPTLANRTPESEAHYKKIYCRFERDRYKWMTSGK
jgi:hypothetical protein